MFFLFNNKIVLLAISILFYSSSHYAYEINNPKKTQNNNNNNNFVGRNGLNFVRNGKRFFLNGFNAYWLMNSAADPYLRQNVITAFQEASKHGMNVARTWGFNDGDYKPLQSSPGIYDEQVFRGLDFVVAEAGKYNIYLIISFVNNFNDFGGKQKYVNWAKAGDKDEFYTNNLAKQYYKNHIKAIITRKNTITGVAYKDDQTIFAWELMNEPRTDNVDPTGSKIQNWVTEMAAYVKSIDRNHLLEIGLEGFYGKSVPERKEYNPNSADIGTDFIANNLVSQIDFATIHLYPEQWLPSQNRTDDEQAAFVSRWIRSHVSDCNSVLKKPLLIGEFGKSSKLEGYTLQKRNIYFKKIYNKIYKSASQKGSLSGGIFWQLMTKGMENQGDGYEVVLDQTYSTALVISQQSQKLYQLSK